jgi:hypothetical protein
MRFANQSLSRLFKITFIVSLTLLTLPSVTFLVLKNRGALEVTFTQMMQIFAYSLAIYLPLGLLLFLF